MRNQNAKSKDRNHRREGKRRAGENHIHVALDQFRLVLEAIKSLSEKQKSCLKPDKQMGYPGPGYPTPD